MLWDELQDQLNLMIEKQVMDGVLEDFVNSPILECNEDGNNGCKQSILLEGLLLRFEQKILKS